MTTRMKAIFVALGMGLLLLGYVLGHYGANHEMSSRLQRHAINAADAGKYNFCKRILQSD